MRNPFRRNQQQPQNNSQDIQVLSSSDLKRNKANDDYINDKKVRDPMYNFINWVIRNLWVVCILSIGYMVYYYLFSPNADPPSLMNIITHVLVYIAGIVTSAMNEVMGHKDS